VKLTFFFKATPQTQRWLLSIKIFSVKQPLQQKTVIRLWLEWLEPNSIS